MEHTPELPRTEAKSVRRAIDGIGVGWRPYKVRQHDHQVHVTYHPDKPITGQTMEATVDTMLTELAYGLANRLVNRYLCTAVTDDSEQCTLLIVTNPNQEPVLPGESPEEREAQAKEDAVALAALTPEQWSYLGEAVHPTRCPQFPDVPLEPRNPRTIAQLKLAAEAAVDLAHVSGFHHPVQLKLDAPYLRKVGRRIADQGHIHVHEGPEYKGRQLLTVAYLMRLLEEALPDYTPGPIPGALLLPHASWDGIRERLDDMDAWADYRREVYPRVADELARLNAGTPSSRQES